MAAIEKIPHSKQGVIDYTASHGMKLVTGTSGPNIIDILEASGEMLPLRAKFEFLLLDKVAINRVWGASNLKTGHIIVVDQQGRDWNDLHYATALHEMGHFVLQAMDEMTPWAWALLHASTWTPAMQDHMVTALKSYHIPFEMVA